MSQSCIHHSDDTLDNVFEEQIDPLQIRPAILAQQITLIELSLFKAIRPEEFLSFKWNGRQKLRYAPQISASTRWFNQLVFWLHREILSLVSVPKRAEMLAHFIKTAKKLVDLKNYYSAKAFVTALQVECIYRLKTTWDAISSRDRSTFAKLCDIFSSDDNFQNLRTLLDAAKPPCIPYLGLYLTDLTYIDVACPVTINHGEAVFTNQIRIDRINNVLRIISYFQTSAYDFIRNDSLATYLESQTYLEELQRFIEDANQKASLRLEPPCSTFADDSTNSTSSSSGSAFRKTHRLSKSTPSASSSNLAGSSSLSGQTSPVKSAIARIVRKTASQSSPIDLLQRAKFSMIDRHFHKAHRRQTSWTLGISESDIANSPSSPVADDSRKTDETTLFEVILAAWQDSPVSQELPAALPATKKDDSPLATQPAQNATFFLCDGDPLTSSDPDSSPIEPPRKIKISLPESLINSCFNTDFPYGNGIPEETPQTTLNSSVDALSFAGSQRIMSSLSAVALRLVDRLSKSPNTIIAEGSVLCKKSGILNDELISRNSLLDRERNSNPSFRISEFNSCDSETKSRTSYSSILSTSRHSSLSSCPEHQLVNDVNTSKNTGSPLSNIIVYSKFVSQGRIAIDRLFSTMSLTGSHSSFFDIPEKLRWAVLLFQPGETNSSHVLHLVLFRPRRRFKNHLGLLVNDSDLGSSLNTSNQMQCTQKLSFVTSFFSHRHAFISASVSVAPSSPELNGGGLQLINSEKHCRFELRHFPFDCLCHLLVENCNLSPSKSMNSPSFFSRVSTSFRKRSLSPAKTAAYTHLKHTPSDDNSTLQHEDLVSLRFSPPILSVFPWPNVPPEGPHVDTRPRLDSVANF